MLRFVKRFVFSLTKQNIIYIYENKSICLAKILWYFKNFDFIGNCYYLTCKLLLSINKLAVVNSKV